MALKKTFPNPFAPGNIEGYCWVGEINLNIAASYGRIVVYVHANADAASEGKVPLYTYSIPLNKEGTPAVYGAPPELTPYVPAVTQQVQTGTDGQGNPVYETQIITPEQLPTYGSAPLLEPAIPPFATLISTQQSAYAAIMTAAYGIIMSRKEFNGATIVPTTHLSS